MRWACIIPFVLACCTHSERNAAVYPPTPDDAHSLVVCEESRCETLGISGAPCRVGYERDRERVVIGCNVATRTVCQSLHCEGPGALAASMRADREGLHSEGQAAILAWMDALPVAQLRQCVPDDAGASLIVRSRGSALSVDCASARVVPKKACACLVATLRRQPTAPFLASTEAHLVINNIGSRTSTPDEMKVR